MFNCEYCWVSIVPLLGFHLVLMNSIYPLEIQHFLNRIEFQEEGKEKKKKTHKLISVSVPRCSTRLRITISDI